MADAITAVREAFVAADQGRAVMPTPMELRMPDADGELHVKGAYLKGAAVFAVKTATGFYRNPSLGLPVSGGMTLVYDAQTGGLQALAADLLARQGARTAALIGTGGQARYQLQALLQVRPVEQVRVWGRRRQAAQQYARDMAAAEVTVSVAATAREAVEGAEVVITAASASQPLVQAGWLAPGAHVTGVGADMPHRQELDPQILAAADKYVPDSIQAAAVSGELHHAIKAAAFDAGSVYGELGAVVSGRLPGRHSADELTVADLTGLGIQDAAIPALVTRLAEQHGVGRDLPLGES
jgi:ornithine cyclodeaminase